MTSTKTWGELFDPHCGGGGKSKTWGGFLDPHWGGGGKWRPFRFRSPSWMTSFPVPQMRSSKMAAGSGRAAIFHLHLNGGPKNLPILLATKVKYVCVTGSCVCGWRHTPSYGVTVLLQVHDTYKNPERQTNTNIKINTLKQLKNQYNIQLWLQKIYIHLTHINLFSIHQCITHQCINASYIIQHTSHIHQHASTLIFVHHSSISIHYSFIHIHHSFINIHASTLIIHSSTFMHQHSSHGIATHHTCTIPVKRHI